MTSSAEAMEAPSWTCTRCGVTARWMPGSIGGGRPAEWREEGEELHCLACRRAVAADAGVEAAPNETTAEGRAKTRVAAMVEFEIRRDPDRANSVIARACRTSVPAVVKARRRIGIPTADARVVAMTTKDDFTEEEWARLERAPMVAGMAISLADPGGPIEVVKETSAALKSVLEAAQAGGDAELVNAVAESAAGKARERKNPMGDFKPRGAMAGQEILDDLRATNELLNQKATPEEAAAFREWLKTAAQRAADAAKEGGFMGFKAERVSEGEQQMLDKLDEVLS